MERVELIEFRPPSGRAICSGGASTWSSAAVPTARSFFPRSTPGSHDRRGRPHPAGPHDRLARRRRRARPRRRATHVPGGRGGRRHPGTQADHASTASRRCGSRRSMADRVCKPDQPLVPSVLIAAGRRPTAELARPWPKTSRTQVLRELKQSVRRDLENLLNTRWRCKSWPENLERVGDVAGELRDSRPHRGGLARPPGGEEFRQRLRARDPALRAAVRPRSRSRCSDNAEPLDRTLRFRINAMLTCEPAPEPVVFDSALSRPRATWK